MTLKQAIAFVESNGVVLESGRGPVLNLAGAIAGAPIRGNWCAHPKANTIFLCSRAVRESTDVLVCRFIDGKVTYVHRRLWPALVRLAGRFDANRLAAIEEVHTPSGKHEVRTTAFPDWVTEDVKRSPCGTHGNGSGFVNPRNSWEKSAQEKARGPPNETQQVSVSLSPGGETRTYSSFEVLFTFTALILFSLTAPAEPPKEKDREKEFSAEAKKELKKLEGKWRIVKLATADKESEAKDQEAYFVLKGD